MLAQLPSQATSLHPRQRVRSQVLASHRAGAAWAHRRVEPSHLARQLNAQQPAERDNQRLQGRCCQTGLMSKGLQSQDQGLAGASDTRQTSMLYALPCLHMVTFILAKRQDHSDQALWLFLPVQYNLLQETFLQTCEGPQPGGMVIVTQCCASKDKPFQKT